MVVSTSGALGDGAREVSTECSTKCSGAKRQRAEAHVHARHHAVPSASATARSFRTNVLYQRRRKPSFLQPAQTDATSCSIAAAM